MAPSFLTTNHFFGHVSRVQAPPWIIYPAMADPSARCQSLHAVKVEDYLGDKIQEIADLQNLDSLLVSLNEQQELQRKQVYIPLVL